MRVHTVATKLIGGIEAKTKTSDDLLRSQIVETESCMKRLVHTYHLHSTYVMLLLGEEKK